MISEHEFGGTWTEEKLANVRKYLYAYRQIFAQNVHASWYKTIYVDAFAGTGFRSTPRYHKTAANPLFNDMDAISFKKGSASIALDIEPAFDKYIFVEQSGNYAKELEKLRVQYQDRTDKIKIEQQEANSFLQAWCKATNWNKTRAVVFLDPYGMQVEWKTIEMMGKTQGIDLWILFPLGQAINRLLIRDQIPEGAWANRLTTFFGTDTWKKSFYRCKKQMTLFGEIESTEKIADFSSIKEFFITRLETVFAKVANNPKPLINTKNVPIFLLYFASANPKGAPTAVKIAQHILEM